MNEDLMQRISNLEDQLASLKDEYYRYNEPTSRIETKAILFKGKVGFFNHLPVDQQSAITPPTGGGTNDANARTAINSIITTLQNLGLTA